MTASEKPRSGFSSVLLAALLPSVLLLLLAAVEISSGYAAGSVTDELCLVAGESVLSEYNSELFEKYGIFALRQREEDLEDMFCFYVDSGLDASFLLNVSLCSCETDCSEYPALDTELFERQVCKLGALFAAERALNADSFFALAASSSAPDPGSGSALETVREIQDLEPAAEDSAAEQESKRSASEQAKTLLGKYSEAMDTEGSGTSADAYGQSSVSLSAVQISSLPSGLLGYTGRRSVLLSGGALSADEKSFCTGEYIAAKCSNALSRRPDLAENEEFAAPIAFEQEYILFGASSDAENLKRTKSSLFALRLPLNIAAIYSDPQKLSEVNALAAAAFPMLPLPAAAFLISGIWAAFESGSDVRLLLSGESVPPVKTPSDWKLSLSAAMGSGYSYSHPGTGTDDSGESPAAGGTCRFGSYHDYLEILLLMLDDGEKLARLMDVIELNTENFCFRDHAFGFRVCAVFEKDPGLLSFASFGVRKKEYCSEFFYR